MNTVLAIAAIVLLIPHIFMREWFMSAWFAVMAIDNAFPRVLPQLPVILFGASVLLVKLIQWWRNPARVQRRP